MDSFVETCFLTFFDYQVTKFLYHFGVVAVDSALLGGHGFGGGLSKKLVGVEV